MKHLLLLSALTETIILAGCDFMTRGISTYNLHHLITTLDTFSFDTLYSICVLSEYFVISQMTLLQDTFRQISYKITSFMKVSEVMCV